MQLEDGDGLSFKGKVLEVDLSDDIDASGDQVHIFLLFNQNIINSTYLRTF